MMRRIDASNFEFFVELGASACASFKLVMEGEASQCFCPSIEDATLNDKYQIHGPQDTFKGSACWTIGKEEWSGRKDSAEQGKRFQIKLTLDDDLPRLVEWTSRLPADVLMEDMYCRGFLVCGQ